MLKHIILLKYIKVVIKISRFDKAYMRSYKINPHSEKEFFDCVSDIYFTDEVQGLAVYEQHMEINRLQHITSVAYLSYLVCKKMGWDYVSAARGAVLHDLFYYDWHEKDSSHRLHGYRHPGFALKNAEVLCGDRLSELEKEVIRRHMWPLTPTPPMKKEAFAVSMCDKYCAVKELMVSIVPKQAHRFTLETGITPSRPKA